MGKFDVFIILLALRFRRMAKAGILNCLPIWSNFAKCVFREILSGIENSENEKFNETRLKLKSEFFRSLTLIVKIPFYFFFQPV